MLLVSLAYNVCVEGIHCPYIGVEPGKHKGPRNRHNSKKKIASVPPTTSGLSRMSYVDMPIRYAAYSDLDFLTNNNFHEKQMAMRYRLDVVPDRMQKGYLSSIMSMLNTKTRGLP